MGARSGVLGRREINLGYGRVAAVQRWWQHEGNRKQRVTRRRPTQRKPARPTLR